METNNLSAIDIDFFFFSGGIGCNYDNGYPPDKGEFAPEIYRKLSYTSNLLNQPIPLTSLPILVRSRYDPYIEWQYQTEGTGDLALSKVRISFILLFSFVLKRVFCF